jgi:hypothetical protein
MLQQFSAAIVVLTGVTMTTGQLSAFSCWLLDSFPALADVG